ncbi:hypothetical protein ASZ90_017721 [hydrocarbon metagenome]|uniref:HTH cro/C1-type domain-containing protein n=1 Tax=hydrocarbon metagenome TaxID=938273 RepID=A0A0W8E8E6_9ZZZZ
MIKTDQEYKCMRAKCEEYQEQVQKQVHEMKARGYFEDEIHCLTGPTTRMLNQSRRDIDIYRRLKKGDSEPLRGLPLNIQLIGLRIYLGISQSNLAALLGITRAELAREENNEYYNLTLERYEEILRAMGVQYIPSYVIGDMTDVEELRNKLIGLEGDQGGILIVG